MLAQGWQCPEGVCVSKDDCFSTLMVIDQYNEERNPVSRGIKRELCEGDAEAPPTAVGTTTGRVRLQTELFTLGGDAQQASNPTRRPGQGKTVTTIRKKTSKDARLIVLQEDLLAIEDHVPMEHLVDEGESTEAWRGESCPPQLCGPGQVPREGA